MVRKFGLGIVITALLAVSGPLRAGAESLEILLDRQDSAIEIFLSLPASEAEELFLLPPRALIDDTGAVPIERMQQGTAEIADALFEHVDARLNGAAVRFEALSLMVHPEDAPVSYDTPFEAFGAIVVCLAPDPLRPLLLENLNLFAGFVLYTDNPNGALELTLPDGDGTPRVVQLRQFQSGERISEARLELAPGAPLMMVAHTPVRMLGLHSWAVGLVAIASAAALMLGWLRRQG